ncbi:MAG: SurA N-terminal domain-containing protein, partial [Candidatus Babeliales bacterium]
MNTYLRKGRQAFIFKIVIWVTAATMVFGGLYISQSDRGSWVALVNGRSVSVDSFAQAVAQEQLRLTQIRQQLGKYASLLLGDAHPTQMAVERLVNEELLNEVADHMGITLDEKHIQRELIKLLPRSVIDETGRVNYSYLEALLPHY